jgi:ABC-type multidrug transport system fused ATPase/permease subunit
MSDMNGAAAAATATPIVKPLPTIPPYGENAIDVANLTFSYRSDSSGSTSSSNRPDNVVLEDLNLTLQTGSRCLLIGANGSGKSVSFNGCVAAWP